MINNLPTPAEQSALEDLTNIDLARLAYEHLGTSIISQGEVLRRFRHLNADYRELDQIHEKCVDWSAKLGEVEKERDSQVEKFHKLSAEHEDVCRRYEACAKREEMLLGKTEEFGREKETWLNTNTQQTERIKQLEAELAASKDLAARLKANNSDLTADLAQAEVVRQNMVKSLVPTVFRRLMDSEEYKKSLAKPLSLSFSAGWLEGIRLARKPEEVDKIIRTSKKVNMEAPSIWKTEFNKVFSLEYPFIKKVAGTWESHQALPLEGSREAHNPHQAVYLIVVV
jgi:chromosome segregation ATPase